MTVPEFTDFPSAVTRIGEGRIYDVHAGVSCLAYGIHDTDSLRFAGAVDGLIVYVFVEQRKVGVWNWARSAEELHTALMTARVALDPDADRPVPLAPGGEPAQIRPAFAIDIEQLLQPRPLSIERDEKN